LNPCTLVRIAQQGWNNHLRNVIDGADLQAEILWHGRSRQFDDGTRRDENRDIIYIANVASHGVSDGGVALEFKIIVITPDLMGEHREAWYRNLDLREQLEDLIFQNSHELSEILGMQSEKYPYFLNIQDLEANPIDVRERLAFGRIDWEDVTPRGYTKELWEGSIPAYIADFKL
jgi:hypothetical protein